MNKNDSNKDSNKDSNNIELSEIDIFINKICNDINNKIRKNKLKKIKSAMIDKELCKILKKIISEKYNITVTDIYPNKKIGDNYWYIRYDHWTNDLKFIKDSFTYVYDKDIVPIIRKMKLEKIEK